MKAWKSVAWSFFGQLLKLTTTLITIAILGRLLAPADFGLFGLVLAVQAIVIPLLDFGLTHVYLKLEDDTIESSNVFFTIHISIGLLVSVLTFFSAKHIAIFYNILELEDLLKLFSVSFFLIAAKCQPQAILSREKKFDTIAKILVLTTFSGSILVILLAWKDLGVWALVWRSLYEATVALLLFSVMARRRLSLSNWNAVKKYINEIRFGLDIFVTRLLSGWVSACDKLILGKYATLLTIGGYTRSMQLARMPDSNIRTALTTPALAYLARITKRNKTDEYLLLNWTIFLLAGTPCLILLSHGEMLLPIIMGEQWTEMGWMLQMLGLFGFARIIQGMFAIYNIDRRDSRRTSKYILGSILGVYTIPSFVLMEFNSIRGFVISLSYMGLAYWCVCFYFSMIQDSPKRSSCILLLVFKQFFIGIFSTFLISKFDLILPSTEHIIQIIFLISVQIILIFSLFIIVELSTAKKFFRMICPANPN